VFFLSLTGELKVTRKIKIFNILIDKFGIRATLTSGMVLITVLACAFVIANNYLNNKNHFHTLNQEIEKRLTTSAILAHESLGLDYHNKITGKNSFTTAEYDKIVDHLNKLCIQFGLEYLWSLMIIDGEIVFTSSTSPGKDVTKQDHAKFFDIHTDPQLYESVFRTMTPVFQTNIDKWGSIKVVLVPFSDIHDRKYLFGSSIKIVDYNSILYTEISQQILVSMIFVVVVLLISIQISRRISEPVLDKVQESEKLYREVVERTDNLITRVDKNGNLTFVNYVGKSIFGINTDSLIGMSAFNFLYPEDQEKTQKWFDECVRNKVVQSSIENRQINKNTNEVNHLLWTCHFKYNEKQEFIGVNGIAHNITERIRAEEKVIESNQRLMTILDSVPADIYVSDMETNKILYMNAQIKESFGTDLTGEICWKVFRNGVEPCLYCTNPILLDDNKQPTGIKIWEDLNKNNKKEYLNYDRAIRWIDDRYVRIQIAMDITQRKQAEGKIKASLKEKNTLIDEIHHRVKNNMNVVSSLLKLQSNNIEDARIKDILKESQNRIYAMSAVHETLHGSENLSEIDLKTYLSKVTSSIFQTYAIAQDKVKLNIDIKEMPIGINQASPLGLIINELISNSLKYAFPGESTGEITVQMKKQDKEIELIVMDDGIGMPDELDWKNAKSLGLKLVRTLVENQLDGSIDMENNDGTKFTIKFNIET
jgi:PAS domain S-box-containing protein